MRVAGFVFVAAIAAATAVTFARDPEEPLAVALFVLFTGIAAASAAMLWQLRERPGGRRRAPRTPLGRALRRAVEVGAVVAALLWLRAVDGLSVLTAAFVILAFVIAEVVVSAQPQSAR